MKPRVGVYLSKRTAARLTSAAKRRGTTKSAIVEAALNRFLDSDAKSDAVMLTDRLADLSGQIGQLDRDLGIVSEIVALHARFHLAVTPELPTATQDSACRRGSARFDEFATQVERRLQRGTSLMQETIERLDPTRPSAFRGGAERGSPSVVAPAADDPDFSAPSQVEVMPEDIAAVREDGSNANFPMQPRSSLH
jgi:Ribbon-helix-helix protein, copG family